MNKESWKSLIHSKILILDGATGSNLQKRGMPSGVCPEEWILKNPDVLCGLQKEYLRAGSDILYAPTFSGNRFKLTEYGLADQAEEMNLALVELSRRAVREYREETGESRPVYIAGDMTMTGQQLPPMGMTDFEELVEVYKEQTASLVKAGVDLIVIETMMSLKECRAALLAVKETCDLPVMVTLTFNEDGHTLYGTDAGTAVIVLQSMGADAVGVNCSAGPDRMAAIIRGMKQYAAIPLIAKPNAGLPKLVGTQTVFDMEPEEYAKGMELLLAEGASIVGGCCGTTPAHISALAKTVAAMEAKPIIPQERHIRALTTERRTLPIYLNERFYLIGERINPTGKKDLQEELRDGDMDLVCEMAEDQEEAGADILDINVGMSGIDEKETMLTVMEEVTMTSALPLCFDTSDPEVMEAALRRYAGRALINSISLEQDRMSLLPLAKKYGAMFILLPLSDKGVPATFEEKKEIIETILQEAYRCGLTKEDVIVDALINTAGANPAAGRAALETIRWCRQQGLAVSAGLSNISYGLPNRQYVNSAFLAMAIGAGLTMAIANPNQELVKYTALASDVLLGREDAALAYIQKTPKRNTTVAPQAKGEEVKREKQASDICAMSDHPLYQAVLKGNKKGVLDIVEEAAKTHSASELLNVCLIPAINEVGVLFDKGIYFLPQLIAAAEAMKKAIAYLEPMLKQGGENKKLGTIIAATVAGDIHDIGKNLVVLMLQNYGFEVIDLGKDVASADIIEAARQKDADIIAVSALMTTTMQVMREIITLRNEANIRAKVMIGGAVITQDYADEIGADAYSANAREAVITAKKLIELFN